MGDPVDAVAKALAMADGFHPEAVSNDTDSAPAWALYMEMARAAIDAYEASRKWRDIRTAPKDGTEVIGCFVSDYGYQKKPTIYGPWTMKWGRHSREWLASWDGDLVIESQSDFGTTYKTTEIEPTHWQPLPEPPQ